MTHYVSLSDWRACDAPMRDGDDWSAFVRDVTCPACLAILHAGEGHAESASLHDSPQIDVEPGLTITLTHADRAFLVRALDTMQPFESWTVADVLRREGLKGRLR